MIAFGYLVLPTGQVWPMRHVHQRGKEDITRRWHSWLDHVLEQVVQLPTDLACLQSLIQVSDTHRWSAQKLHQHLLAQHNKGREPKVKRVKFHDNLPSKTGNSRTRNESKMKLAKYTELTNG